MPGVPCSYGDVTRLDLPLPFFLRTDPFKDIRIGTEKDYSWDPLKNITLLVHNKELPKPLPRTGDEDGGGYILGGCPLECPFDPNENFDDALNLVKPEQIFPGLEFPMDLYECLNLDTCRTLLRKIYERDGDVLESLGLNTLGGKRSFMNPIYLACNGSPTSNDLVLIGFDEDKFLELRMMGPYKSKSPFLDMNLFLAYHQHLPHVIPGAVRKYVHAIYEKIHGDFQAGGKVFLEFIWAEPKSIFEPPPTMGASAKLAIKPKPGDANPFLKKFWLEIEEMEFMIQLRELNQGRELNKTYHYHHNVSIEGPSIVVDEMKELMKLPSIPFWDKDTDFSNSIETVLERVLNSDRSDVDFTDKAWTILKKATTVVEIYESFYNLLENIESKKYRPYLFPSNTTIFGSLLKELLTDKIKNFRTMFTPALALDMTVDFGIHKLFRDYSFVLKMCNLAQLSDLDHFTPKTRMFRESLHSLKKLHCLFEILCLSKERLTLNMCEQESQAQVVLEYFEKNPLNWEHTFHFNVPMATVEPIIVGMNPVYWNLKLESSTALRVSRTNAILSRDFFVCHADKLFATPERTLPRGYYLYVHRVAQRRTTV